MHILGYEKLDRPEVYIPEPAKALQVLNLGQVAEWPKAPDCESGRRCANTVPGVRIPPCPSPGIGYYRSRPLNVKLDISQLSSRAV
jgi:hypothetical protein